MATYGRFLVNGTANYGEVQGDTIHFVDDIFGDARPNGESAMLGNAVILPSIAPSKLFAIGLNYADHAKESGQEVPKWPLSWFKAPTAIIAHQQTVELAYPEHRTDWEAELTIVIGKQCKGVSEADALDYIFGYTPGQDISDRDVQFGESQWARAKSFDTYAPHGPFIYTGIDPSNLPIQCLVNGEVKQTSTTSQLVYNPAKLVSFLSEFITLLPGDAIMTGTPFGVGPLKEGDVIETHIGEMAPLINPVRNAKK